MLAALAEVYKQVIPVKNVPENCELWYDSGDYNGMQMKCVDACVVELQNS